MAPSGRDEGLTFLSCGSVDDGKSTLLGRLLVDTGNVFEDQLAALEVDSRRHGTRGGERDFALLLDGLQAEREQGITVDVAWRYFSTSQRRFVVADTPGHAQYTRNMVTGASRCSAAVLLVDARKGLLTQTLRHARLCAWAGIRHLALAVNKMDAVGWAEGPFRAAVEGFAPHARALGLEVQPVPVSAVDGDFVAAASTRAPWYQGPTLLQWLEQVPVAAAGAASGAVLPVQLVLRAGQDFRGLAGEVAAGTLRPGMAVRALPAGRAATVKRLLGPHGEVAEAHAGEPVVVELDEPLDVARGHVLVAGESPAQAAEEVELELVWMADAPLVPGRSWWVRVHGAEVTGTVTEVLHRVDVETGAEVPAPSVELNDLARVRLVLDRPVVVAPHGALPRLGYALLVDRRTTETAGAGRVHAVTRASRNLTWQPLQVDRAARARALGQRPRCIWLTGLPGAGKSTLANLLDQALHARGHHAYVLDGDNVRMGLNRDLGFSERDRAENVRRVAEVARLMVDAGLVVITAFISPARAERARARELFAPGEFVEVFVDAPVEACEARDPKGLYARARRGELRGLTGVDSPYEAPVAPEVRVSTAEQSPAESLERLLAHLDLDAWESPR